MPDEPRDASGPGFTGRVLIVLGLVSLLAILWLVVWHALYLLLLVFAGVLVAVLLRAASDPLARVTGMPPWVAVLLVVVGLGVAVVAGGALLADPVSEQVTTLRDQLPAAVEELVGQVRSTAIGRDLLDELPSGAGAISGDLVQRAGSVVSSTLEGVVYLLVVLFIGVYLALQPRLYVEGTIRLLPLGHRARAREVLGELGATLRWWLVGRIAAMVAVGVLTAIGLWFLDVPLSLTLAILAGLLDFIPNIGPVIAAVPAVLIALLDSPTTVLWVILLYTAVQQVEALLLTPILQHRTVDLPPGLTLFAQVLMGVLAGILGLALATPLAAVVLVLVQMVYRHDILGDPVASRGGLDDRDSAEREQHDDEDTGPPLPV